MLGGFGGHGNRGGGVRDISGAGVRDGSGAESVTAETFSEISAVTDSGPLRVTGSGPRPVTDSGPTIAEPVLEPTDLGLGIVFPAVTKKKRQFRNLILT